MQCDQNVIIKEKYYSKRIRLILIATDLNWEFPDKEIMFEFVLR